MAEALPEFERPPLIETVIGFQFHPLRLLTAAHLGLFWQAIRGEWPHAAETEAMGQIAEQLEPASSWVQPGLEVKLTPSVRLRFTNDTGDRMIQVENGWLVLNWRRNASSTEYPRFERIRECFEEVRRQFDHFLSEQDMGSVEPNLWEVNYINAIPRTSLWERPADWPRLLPRLLAPASLSSVEELQTATASWSFTLAGAQGRLRITSEHGQIDEQQEALLLSLVARGPARSAQEVVEGLERGHVAIVRSFEEITSAEAHAHWGKHQ